MFINPPPKKLFPIIRLRFIFLRARKVRDGVKERETCLKRSRISSFSQPRKKSVCDNQHLGVVLLNARLTSKRCSGIIRPAVPNTARGKKASKKPRADNSALITNRRAHSLPSRSQPLIFIKKASIKNIRYLVSLNRNLAYDNSLKKVPQNEANYTACSLTDLISANLLAAREEAYTRNQVEYVCFYHLW